MKLAKGNMRRLAREWRRWCTRRNAMQRNTTQSVKMLQSQTRKIPKGSKLLKKEDTEYEVDNDVKENAGEGEE